MKQVIWFILFVIGFSITAYSQRVASATRPAASFVKNEGQWNETISYCYDANGGRVFLTKTGWRILSASQADLHRVHEMRGHKDSVEMANAYLLHAYGLEWAFEGANDKVCILPVDKQSSYNNYFIGSDKRKWKSKVPLYGNLVYKQLYDGVDMKLERASGNLKYSFVVDASFDLAKLRYKIKGAHSLALKDGRLQIGTSLCENEEYIPAAYLEDFKGNRTQVDCHYVLYSDTSVGFATTAKLTKGQRLIIDPVLVIGSYAWSTATSYGFTATYDKNANLYLGTECFNLGWACTNGAFQTTYGGSVDDAIDKFNSTGSALLFSTYIGGASFENPRSMIVNSLNQLYVLSVTQSNDFPSTSGSFQNALNGSSSDLAVSCFNVGGTQLIASTFVGGSANEGANAIGFVGDDFNRGEINLDRNEDVLVASSTTSIDFPVTNGAFQTVLGGLSDGVLFKMNKSLNQMIWSTYVGGTQDDNVMSIATDLNNDVWVTGGTESLNFYMPAGATISTNSGAAGGYILKFTSNGILQKGTFNNALTGADQGYFIQIDRFGDVYIMGLSSLSFASTPGHYYTANGTMYIQKWNASSLTMTWVSVFGPTTTPGGFSLLPTAFLVDNCGYIYLCGHTNGGPPFLTTGNAYMATPPGSFDFVLMQLSPNAQMLTYCTYFGGSGFDHVDGGTSRFDKRGVVYEAVCSGSTNMPSTNGSTNSTGFQGYGFKFDFQNNVVLAQGGASSVDTFCVPQSISFTNTSFNATNYSWDFGDGSPIDTNRTPTHTFTQAGNYQITLIASNPATCNFTDTFKLNVVALSSTKPTAAFNVQSNCSNMTAQFNNTSIGANNYAWNFGDNTFSNLINPVHQYASNGNYTITLIVTNTLCGGADTFSKNIQFIANLPITIYPSDTTLCVGESFCIDSIKYGSSGVLNLIVPAGFTEVSKKCWRSTIGGDFNFMGIVDYPFGCPSMDTFIFTVHVREIPKVSFDYLKSMSPGENLVSVAGLVSNASSYWWEISNGVKLTNVLNWSLNVSPNYKVNVCLIAENEYACRATVCKEIIFAPTIDHSSAFSPNADGKNDTWGVLVSVPELITRYDLKIYNRWGECVFVSDSYSKRWDGTYKGLPQEISEYIFVYEIDFVESAWNKSDRGHLTLLR